MTPKRSESSILSEVLRLLKARGIFALRMQVGAARAVHKGRERYVRWGIPGMADVLAVPKSRTGVDVGSKFYEVKSFNPIWIECKTAKGKQSPAQREFQAVVEAEGHSYLIVRSAWELYDWLKTRGL